MQATTNPSESNRLSLLVILHRVYAVLGLLWLGFCAVKLSRLHDGFQAALDKSATHPPINPMVVILVFNLVFGAITILGILLNIYNAHLIQHRKRRIFICVIAGLNCMSIPLGSALGVFTLLELAKPSVRELFGTE